VNAGGGGGLTKKIQGRRSLPWIELKSLLMQISREKGQENSFIRISRLGAVSERPLDLSAAVVDAAKG
jgi:hypothetical protein